MLSSTKDGFMRRGSAIICEAQCIHASTSDIEHQITPCHSSCFLNEFILFAVVLDLAEDSELNVRLHAISALQQISVVASNVSQLMEKIYNCVEHIMTTDVAQVLFLLS